MFSLGTDLPYDGADAGHDGEHDGGVLLPVGGLGVPASGGRPDIYTATITLADTHFE
jgi:hypothetical protein